MYPNYYGLNMNMPNPYQNYNQNYGQNYSQNNFPSLQMQQPKIPMCLYIARLPPNADDLLLYRLFAFLFSR